MWVTKRNTRALDQIKWGRFLQHRGKVIFLNAAFRVSKTHFSNISTLEAQFDRLCHPGGMDGVTWAPYSAALE